MIDGIRQEGERRALRLLDRAAERLRARPAVRAKLRRLKEKAAKGSKNDRT